MKALQFSVVLVLCFGSFACKSKTETSVSESPGSYRDLGSAKYEDKDFSAWMSKAEQQIAYDTRPADTYFAFTEGKNNGGFNQYRHVKTAIPKDKYAEWAVFWGLSAEEFYQLELKMLKNGFARQNLQVFTDSQGQAMHQVVWLKPKATAH